MTLDEVIEGLEINKILLSDITKSYEVPEYIRHQLLCSIAEHIIKKENDTLLYTYAYELISSAIKFKRFWIQGFVGKQEVHHAATRAEALFSYNNIKGSETIEQVYSTNLVTFTAKKAMFIYPTYSLRDLLLLIYKDYYYLYYLWCRDYILGFLKKFNTAVKTRNKMNINYVKALASKSKVYHVATYRYIPFAEDPHQWFSLCNRPLYTEGTPNTAEISEGYPLDRDPCKQCKGKGGRFPRFNQVLPFWTKETEEGIF